MTPDGKPIPEARVTLLSANHPQNPVIVTTDSAGRFRVTGLAYRTWTIEWQAKGCNEEYGTTGGMFGMRIPTQVMLSPTSDPLPNTFVMRPTVVLSGFIRDTRGALLKTRRIRLVSGPNMHAEPWHYELMTDANGCYEVEFGYARGPSLGAWVPGAPGYAPLAQVRLPASGRVRIDFQLVRGATIVGRAVDSHGTAITSATVDARSPNENSSPGAFSFEAEEQPSRWPVVGRASDGSDGLKPARLNIKWLSAATTDSHGAFRLIVNPNLEYNVLGVTASHYTPWHRSPNVKLRDGEVRRESMSFST